MKVKNLLSKHQNWTRNAFARTGNGAMLDDIEIHELTDSQKPARMCLLGAVAFACRKNPEESKVITNKIMGAIRKYYPYRFGTVESFNDDEDITFSDIKRVLKAANV
jgi:hypothetical protein